MAQYDSQPLEIRINTAASDATKRFNELTKQAEKLKDSLIKAGNSVESIRVIVGATERGDKIVAKLNNDIEKTAIAFNKLGNIKSVDNIAKQAEKLSKALSSEEAEQRMASLSENASNLSKKIEEAGYKIDSIKKIATASDDTTKAVIKASNEFETLTYNMDKSGNVTSITKAKKAVKDLGQEGEKTGKKINKLFSIGKLYHFWNMTKGIRDTLANIVSSAIDFVETENKFNVSMQGMSEAGYKFVNSMSETFGMAREEIMNYQSTYNNIMKSLSGITEETAYEISESITKMAIDYASLYNVSTEESMTKFQSALVGSVRPIRSESGYDITETTIGEKAKELGITSPVRQLSQMEKRLLRIMVLMDQMKKTSAMGDFARTIEEPANQLKILSNQLKELGVWIGNALLQGLKNILPYINGVVMALKEVAKMIAILFGYEANTGTTGPLVEADEATSGMADNLGTAVSNAKALKGILMGFDVLNVIQTPSSGSASTGSVGSIDPKILEAMKEYDNLMDNVSMKATKIRDSIMEWLGFTKSVNESTGEVTWKLKDGYTNLEKIRDIIIAIAGTAAVVGIVKIITGVVGGITKIKTLLFGAKAAAATATAATATATTGIVTKATAAISGIVTKATAALAPITAKMGAVFGTGIAGVGTFSAVAAPFVALAWGIKKVNENALSTEQSLNVFDKTISKSTKEAVAPFLEKMQQLGTTVQGLDFKEIITETDVANIKNQVDELTKTIADSVQNNYSEIQEVLNNTEYFPDKEKRETYLKEAKAFYKEETATVKKYSDEINEIYAKAQKENRNLTKQEYEKIETLTLQMTNKGIETLSKSQKEALKIKAKFNSNYLDLETEQISDSIKNAKKLKDDTIKLAEEDYKEKLALAEEARLTLPGFTQEMYDEMVKSAKESYNEQVTEAENSYDDIIEAATTKYPEITKIIDLETGEMKTYWQLFGDKISEIFGKTEKGASESVEKTRHIMIDGLNLLTVDINKMKPTFDIKVKTPTISEIQAKYNNKVIDLKARMKIDSLAANSTNKKDYLTPHQLLTSMGLKIAPYAQGGFPSVGEMFVAREAGPELVGTIGNKSAVVNNQQIVQAVSQGVAEAVSGVMGRNGGSFNLYIDGQQITDVVTKRMNRMANITGGYAYGQ